MKFIKFLVAGIMFGIVMAKSEAISWYRIQEMFRFDSLHMYGIIGVAVVLGVIGVAVIKKLQLKNIYGQPIVFIPKEKGFVKYLLGGILFGLGWALTGACPGPIVVNIGYGFLSFFVVFIFAIVGTYVFGVVKNKFAVKAVSHKVTKAAKYTKMASICVSDFTCYFVKKISYS